MEQHVLSFLLKSLCLSAIIPVISALNALFGKAFPAKLRYAIWLVVLAGLIIPLPPAIDRGIITIPLPAPVQTQHAAAENPIFETFPETAPVIPDTTAIASPFSGKHIPPFIICVFIWGIIALAVFIWHIWRYFRFLQTIKRWGVNVKDEYILSMLRDIQAEMGLKDKNINLKICGFVSSSMLTGFLRPVILLPEKYFENDELRLILRHELIHYKHRDLFVKLLSVIAISIYWFNPLIYWMNETMQADGEASCDEEVLLDCDKENRRFYAEVIIGMAGGKNTAATMLSTCFFYRSKFIIKKRLDAIMDTTQKTKWPAVIVLAAVLALVFFSGSVFALAVQEQPTGLTPRSAAQELPLAVNTGIETALSRAGGGTAERIEFKSTQAYNSARISFKKAMETAVARIGGGTVEEVELEHEMGMLIYMVTVRYENLHYKVRVDAITGEIVF